MHCHCHEVWNLIYPIAKPKNASSRDMRMSQRIIHCAISMKSYGNSYLFIMKAKKAPFRDLRPMYLA